MEHINCAVISVLGATSVMLTVVEVVSSVMLTAKSFFTENTTKSFLTVSKAESFFTETTTKSFLTVSKAESFFTVTTAKSLFTVTSAKSLFTITTTLHLASLSEASLVAHAFHSILTVATVIHTVASLVVSVLVHEASFITVVAFEMTIIFTAEVLNTTHLVVAIAISAHHLASAAKHVFALAHLISADFTSHVVASSEFMSSRLMTPLLMSTKLSVHGGLTFERLVTELVSWGLVSGSLKDSGLVLFCGL